MVWEVPSPVLGSTHKYKYRLFFGTADRRIIGYDNERGKGDHRHYEGGEAAYHFRDIATLENDFENEVTEWLARNRGR